MKIRTIALASIVGLPLVASAALAQNPGSLVSAAKDGDGSLLDHSMVMYGAGLSDANLHLYTDLPLVLIGSGDGSIQGGVHVRYPKRTPMANLLLTMLDKAGVPHVDKLGDSTGRLQLPGTGSVKLSRA